jgi:type IV pilus assembly protein PilB
MGMRTLREDGIRKIGAGITTIEEVMRVTMGDLD